MQFMKMILQKGNEKMICRYTYANGSRNTVSLVTHYIEGIEQYDT